MSNIHVKFSLAEGLIINGVEPITVFFSMMLLLKACLLNIMFKQITVHTKIVKGMTILTGTGENL